jgi:hypothetical protein
MYCFYDSRLQFTGLCAVAKTNREFEKVYINANSLSLSFLLHIISHNMVVPKLCWRIIICLS